MPRRPADLSATAFRRALRDAGFTFLPLTAEFLDARHRGAPRVPAVRRGRAIDRRATLAALEAAREFFMARQAAVAAERERRERIAATLAPHVLAAPRGTLDGSAAIAQLADDLLVVNTRQDGVTAADLLRIGWRRAQLAEHLEPARSLAYARQNGVAA